MKFIIIKFLKTVGISTRVVWKVRAKWERWYYWRISKLCLVSSISWKNTHQVSARSVYFFVFGIRFNRRSRV